MKRFVLFIVLLLFNISLCQIQLPVSDTITNYLFAKSEKEKLSIITTNGIFELNNNSYNLKITNSLSKPSSIITKDSLKIKSKTSIVDDWLSITLFDSIDGRQSFAQISLKINYQ